MLPLWLIDIRGQSVRRDEFQDLLRRIDHVWMPPRNLSEPVQQVDAADTVPQSPAGIPMPVADIADSLHDELDRKDRHEADRNTAIIGDYWRYTVIDPKDFNARLYEHHDSLSVNDLDTYARETAQELYRFQNALVAQGQQFIRMLRESNAHADIKINIVVLGDLSEEFTRLVFPAIAGLLQKEKGRILPHHIHQGMEIIGMLFIPSDINTRHVSERKSMLRTLREIDVQHRVNDLRGYDHMMYYQDVPNRTENAYPLLSDRQVQEYLLQCLVHLYLATNDSHPLLSGTSSADVFYFSMGATSVHFDTRQEDLKVRYRMISDIIRALKSDGDNEHFSQNITLIDKDDYKPDTFFDAETLNSLGQVDDNVELENPHPVRDFFNRTLKRRYYNSILRFFSTNLMKKIIADIEESTRQMLDRIATRSRRTFTDASARLFERIRSAIGQLGASDGGIPAINRLLKDFQQKIGQRRKNIRQTIEREFWEKVIDHNVPRRLRDHFINYHDAFDADNRSNGNDAQQLELKKQAIKELNSLLSREATTLGRIARSVLLGVIAAFGLLPVLCVISPSLIDIGDVYAYRYIWGVVLFLLPAALQFPGYWRYCRSKRRARQKLQAMYLHDAFARVANRFDSEINGFYDKMTDLAGQYIKRCETLSKELGSGMEKQKEPKSLFPATMFNQPLIGGRFGRDTLLPTTEADDTMVRINYISYQYSELGGSEFFIFINQHKKLISELFKDVSLTEPLSRRILDDGREELLSKEQQETEQKQKWQENQRRFYLGLSDAVDDSIMPREYATVGEKLVHYCQSSADHTATMRCAIDFATINGEITSSADCEFADIKINDAKAEQYIIPYFPTPAKKAQIDRYNPVYMKCIFISRWRCFEHLNLNRLLPTEDFDEKAHYLMVYEAEEREKAKRDKKKSSDSDTPPAEESASVPPPVSGYTPRPSSLLLWALCFEDSSTEWFRLFDSGQFAQAYRDKKIYRECLNQND